MRLEGNQGGDAAGHTGHFAGFLDADVAPQDFLLAVREPFFDDLAPADGEFPNTNRDVFPVDVFIQVNVRPDRSL